MASVKMVTMWAIQPTPADPVIFHCLMESCGEVLTVDKVYEHAKEQHGTGNVLIDRREMVTKFRGGEQESQADHQEGSESRWWEEGTGQTRNPAIQRGVGSTKREEEKRRLKRKKRKQQAVLLFFAVQASLLMVLLAWWFEVKDLYVVGVTAIAAFYMGVTTVDFLNGWEIAKKNRRDHERQTRSRQNRT